MEERRLLLAVALSLVVLTAYSLLFSPASRRPRSRRPSGRLPAPAGAAAPTAAGRGRARRAGRGRADHRPAAPDAPPARPVADERERRVEVAAPASTRSPSRTRGRASSPGPSRTSRTRGADPRRWCRAQGGSRGRSTSRPATRRSTRGCARRSSSPRPRRLAVHGDAARRRCASPSRTGRARGREDAVASADGRPRRGERLGAPRRRRACRGGSSGGPASATRRAEETDVQRLPGAGGRRRSGAGRRARPGREAARTARPSTRVRWAGIESHYFAALLVAALGRRTRERSGRSRCPARRREADTIATVAAVDASGPEPVLLFVGAKDYHGTGPARPRAAAGGAGRGLDRPDRGAAHGPPALGPRPRRQLGLGDRARSRSSSTWRWPRSGTTAS